MLGKTTAEFLFVAASMQNGQSCVIDCLAISPENFDRMDRSSLARGPALSDGAARGGGIHHGVAAIARQRHAAAAVRAISQIAHNILSIDSVAQRQLRALPGRPGRAQCDNHMTMTDLADAPMFAAGSRTLCVPAS
jgi:hypothetical protein